MPSQIPYPAPTLEVMGWAMWSAKHGHSVAVLATSLRQQDSFYKDAVEQSEHDIDTCGQVGGAKLITMWGGGTVTIYVMQAARGVVHDITIRPYDR